MIRVICDGCEVVIDRDANAWFGVDVPQPPQPMPDDFDDGVLMAELRTFTDDHEFHFCSAECLSSWAFAREIEGDPT